MLLVTKRLVNNKNRISGILTKALGDDGVEGKQVLGKSKQHQQASKESKWSLKAFKTDDRLFVKDDENINTRISKKTTRGGKNQMHAGIVHDTNKVYIPEVGKNRKIDTEAATEWKDDLDNNDIDERRNKDSWPEQYRPNSFSRGRNK